MSLLSVHELAAFYGDFQALFGITLRVDAGETVAVIGSNGAGKTTFLKAVSGLLPVPSEAVRFAGQPVGARPAPEPVALGTVMVPEGPGVARGPSGRPQPGTDLGGVLRSLRRGGDRPHRPGPPARRSLCALCDGIVADLRRDAARQPRARRSQHPRGLPGARHGPGDRYE